MSAITLKEAAQKPDLLTRGHRLCAGCAESIIVRQVLKAADAPTMITSATGCLEVATSIFPYTAWNVPWIHTAFENVAANASGMEAAWKGMRRKKKGPLAKYEDLNIIAINNDYITGNGKERLDDLSDRLNSCPGFAQIVYQTDIICDWAIM